MNTLWSIILTMTVAASANAAPQAEVIIYAKHMKEIVEKQFMDKGIYTGKTCTLRIHLERNGIISGANVENGDPELCNAAKNAVIGLDVGRPDNAQYEQFNNAVIDFKL